MLVPGRQQQFLRTGLCALQVDDLRWAVTENGLASRVWAAPGAHLRFHLGELFGLS